MVIGETNKKDCMKDEKSSVNTKARSRLMAGLGSPKEKKLKATKGKVRIDTRNTDETETCA